jgi:sugar phosphate isomerase/epimerase
MRAYVPVALVLAGLSSPAAVAAAEPPPAIPIGYCARLGELDAVRAAGFDYVELRTTEIEALSDADFEKLAEDLKRNGPPVPVTYLFIPAAIKLTGPAIDESRQMEYVRKALGRVSRLGATTVVLGSGPARNFPEGFPRETAFRQLAAFCRRLAPEARARGVVIAVEPQRRQESNLVNSVAEGLELLRAVDDASIQLTVDFYHLAEANEDPAVLLEAAPFVRHLHMANPAGRVFPLREEEYDYAPFFETLRRIDYRGRMSIEARSADLGAEAPRAIAFLRKALPSR